MKLHILGKSSGSPGASGSCSGYLIESSDQKVMLDCGPGTLSQLLRKIRLEDLNVVLVTHMHADHFLDLIPLAYALMERCLTLEEDRYVKKVNVLLPEGGIDILKSISTALGHPAFIFPELPDAPQSYIDFRKMVQTHGDFVFSLLMCREYRFYEMMKFSGVQIEFAEVNHRIPASAVRIESEGSSFVYSGDTAYCEELVKTAEDVDLLLCEATVTTSTQPFYPYHLSPYEAGLVAERANVGELILTHYWHGADENWLVEEARKAYSGKISVALEGGEVVVGSAKEEKTR